MPTEPAPRGVATDPTGHFLFIASENSGTISSFQVDQTSGALTLVGSVVSQDTIPFSVSVDPSGRFLLVEYNTNHGNVWVPYPLSYPTWESMAKRCGFAATRLLATHPSRFLNEIYSAQSTVV